MRIPRRVQTIARTSRNTRVMITHDERAHARRGRNELRYTQYGSKKSSLLSFRRHNLHRFECGFDTRLDITVRVKEHLDEQT